MTKKKKAILCFIKNLQKRWYNPFFAFYGIYYWFYKPTKLKIDDATEIIENF